MAASDPAREAVLRLPALADRAGLLGVVAAEAALADGAPWLDAPWRSRGSTAPCWWSRCPPTAPGRGRVARSPRLDGRPGAGFVRLNFGTVPDPVAEMVRRIARAR